MVLALVLFVLLPGFVGQTLTASMLEAGKTLSRWKEKLLSTWGLKTFALAGIRTGCLSCFAMRGGRSNR